MPVTRLNITFDGASDVPRLIGQSPVSFYDRFMDYYNVHESDPGNELIAIVSLSDGDWRLVTLRFGADLTNTLNLSDSDGSGGRRIDFLQLGYNSDVDLISTRVRYIFGWDGDKHEVTLGNEQEGSTFSVNLFARQNDLTTGNAWVGIILTGGEGSGKGDTITIGSGGAGTVQTGVRNDTVTTSGGWVETILTGDGRDAVTIGTGGAGYVRTDDGDDRVTTGSGYVELISTRAGDDVVRLGTGGLDIVKLGDGDDTLFVNAITPEWAMTFRGGAGTDTVDFSQIRSTGVVFTLDAHGAMQNIGHRTGDITAAPEIGYVAEAQFENITGTRKGDRLTGDFADNVLKGGNGRDRLTGNDGEDLLIGGGGHDRLDGGGGDDTLRGNGGRDTFVFGAGSGDDRILGYQGRDTIEIADHSGGFRGLTIRNDSGDRVIEHDGGTIRLVGDAGLRLTADDFDFA